MFIFVWNPSPTIHSNYLSPLGLEFSNAVFGPSFTCLRPDDKTSYVTLKFETSEFNFALLGSMLFVTALSLPFLEMVTG